MISPTERTARRSSGTADSPSAGESPRPDTGPQGSASLPGRVRAPFLRAFAAVCIVLGLSSAGFAWWEEWGTGIQTAAAQDDLEHDFAAIMAASLPNPGVTPSFDSPTDATPVWPSAPSSTLPAVTVPSTSPGPAPVESAPPPAPVTVPTLPLVEGDTLGRIEIPAIGVDWIAVHGVRNQDIDRGPGHFPGTPQPGQPGNSAFAGHRTTHGAPFNRIDELVDGDVITVTTPAGRFEYAVFGQQIVDETDVWVIETGDPDVAVLTLISCHPKRSTAQRIVVNAILIES